MEQWTRFPKRAKIEENFIKNLILSNEKLIKFKGPVVSSNWNEQDYLQIRDYLRNLIKKENC